MMQSHSMLSEIVSLPVTIIAHVPVYVRLLLPEVSSTEFQYARYSGIWGFVRLFAFSKSCPSLPTWTETETYSYEFIAVFAVRVMEEW